MLDSNHSPQACRALFARMSEYLDNELDDTLRRLVEHHLAHCQACHVCFATLKRTVALCRGTEMTTIPKDVSLRLQKLAQRLQSKK